MLLIHLQTTEGEKLTIHLREGWQDVTTAEYIAMQGKPEGELLQLLTGLTPEQLGALEPEAAAFFAEQLASFTKLPEVEVLMNVESETVGQFETAKSFLCRFYREDAKTARAKVLPYVYGLYMAEKVNGEWSEKLSIRLANEAQGLPAADVVPFAIAVLEQIEKVSQNYEELARDEDAAGDEAGEDELEAFGFYPVLHTLSGGDILKHAALMQQSVRSVYTHLYYLKRLAASQKTETV